MTEMRLILEHAPSSQATTEVTFRGGQLSVGRGEDADWRIHDPENFVSRKHFVLSTDGDDIVLTDASSGGLFVDGATEALGAGNSVRAEDGMRVRFGDFVARVEMNEAPVADAPEPQRTASPFDFTFEPVEEKAPTPMRPDTLPEPFGTKPSPFFSDEPEEKKTPEPINRDNPFALGLKPSKPSPAPEEPSSHGGYFSDPAPEREPAPEPDPRPAPDPEHVPGISATPVEPVKAAPMRRAARSVADADLRAAFFRGLGLDPEKMPTEDAEAEMEAIGRRFRALTDGLMHLLKTRAAEKQKVRIAQTIIGSRNVNPLKFAVSAEEATASLVASRGEGYLDPDDCIDEAFRDLIDHQMRTWSALQSSLRGMIDKFEPDAIEKELEETGLLETLIAGGRNAKLWQLYQERYEDIARAAEERFLGEVGADFRDAYER